MTSTTQTDRDARRRSQVVSLTKAAVRWLIELDDDTQDTPVSRLWGAARGHDYEGRTAEGLREMYRTEDAEELAAYVEDVLMQAAKDGKHGIGAVSALRGVIAQARR